MTLQVLFVDDEADLRRAAEQALRLADLEVTLCADAKSALAQLDPDFPGILVTDIRMAGMDGLALMKAARERDADLPVILVTGHGDVELAVQSMRDGAYDFIEKPYSPARLVDTVRRALEKRRLTLELRALRAAVRGGDGGAAEDPIATRLTGDSDAMSRFRMSLRAVAETDADLLIEGATGTGKAEAARALHEASARGARPLVQINCAALPAGVIESELFGHEAGAFPGATRARYGKFEHARGGSVVLDNIDSLPLELQGKLLLALEERQITRLGAHEPVALDVRFIATAKNDLEAAAQAGRFRADLLYRLNVVTLRLPALQDRPSDIPLLFQRFVADAAERHARPTPPVTPDHMAALGARDWPGNLRELRNAAERFVLGLDIPGAEGGAGTAQTLAERVAAYEKSLLEAALAEHGGRLKSTYAALGLSRKALYEKMQKHRLSREDYLQGEDDPG